ncbi:MAG: hypothetical protein H0W89_05965, partial [Candidatus Levybacteria bacterium]|nr:hypothetical protein [Candidatus Levybacteria bacterium]
MASKRVKQKVKASVSNQSVIVTTLQNKGLYLFGILGIMLIISASIVLQKDTMKPTQDIKSTFNAVVGRPVEEPAPTPYPFYDLTIPYLREQTFISSLNDLEEVSRTEDYISYVTSFTSDGFTVNGLLTQPTGEPPAQGWPAIVFIHGYIPPSQYTTLGESYSTYVDYLARSGFVVFKIDLRGHGDSEGTPGGAYYS